MFYRGGKGVEVEDGGIESVRLENISASITIYLLLLLIKSKLLYNDIINDKLLPFSSLKIAYDKL